MIIVKCQEVGGQASLTISWNGDTKGIQTGWSDVSRSRNGNRHVGIYTHTHLEQEREREEACGYIYIPRTRTWTETDMGVYTYIYNVEQEREREETCGHIYTYLDKEREQMGVHRTGVHFSTLTEKFKSWTSSLNKFNVNGNPFSFDPSQDYSSRHITYPWNCCRRHTSPPLCSVRDTQFLIRRGGPTLQRLS